MNQYFLFTSILYLVNTWHNVISIYVHYNLNATAKKMKGIVLRFCASSELAILKDNNCISNTQYLYSRNPIKDYSSTAMWRNLISVFDENGSPACKFFYHVL